MGLSRRRRAEKSAPSRAVGAPLQTLTPEDDGRVNGARGCTLRKATRLLTNQRRCGLVSFEVLPFEYSQHYRRPEGGRFTVRPNENHRHGDRITVADYHYDSRVAYSLNKKSRWDIQEQLAEQCRSSDDTLRDHSMFLFDTEWRPQGSRGKLVTRRLATNVDHMRMAANELRSRISSSSKQGDKVSFSNQVAQAQQDRLLVSFGGRRGRVNRNSLLRAFEMPTSGFADAEALRFESCGRKTLNVDIRKPAPGITGKVPHSRLVDQTHFSREHRQRWNCQHGALLEDDFCDFENVDCESDDESNFDDSLDEFDAPYRSSGLTLFDAMRVKSQSKSTTTEGPMSLNTEADAPFEHEGWILVSEDEEDADDDKVPSAMLADVHSVLQQKRPVLHVESHLASPERLEQLFAGTNALSMSDSQPRKFSVLLQDNLHESVSFEVVSEDNGYTKIAARHSSLSDDVDPMWHRRTSAAKIASMPDPFKFLRGLLSPVAGSSEGLVVYTPQHGQVPIGWCRTEVWMEADARLAALRALPMFATSATSTALKASTVHTDSTQIECSICNNLLRVNAAAEFSKRSTALGGCGHRFCNSCWVRHVASCLNAGGTRVECPSSGCPTVIDAAVLLWFCPQRLLPVLASAAFRAWQRRSPVSRFCPLPRCGRLLVAADDRGKSAMCCCWTSFCLLCGQEPHWPVDCATAERYLREMAVKGHGNLRSRDLFAVTSVRGKRCPGCRMLVEKDEGCRHMSCACGQSFCWDCCGEFSGDHACGEQRADFIHRKFFAEDDLLAPTSERSLVFCTAVKVRRARHDGPRLLESQAHLAARLLSTAGRSAANSEQLVADAIMASYLLEYTCVLLDANEADDRWQSATHSTGECIQQLLRSVHAELQLEGRGFGDLAEAGKASQVCDRLAGLVQQLETECQRLREILGQFGGQFRAN